MCSKIYWEDINLVKVFINDSIKSLDRIEKEILKLEIRLDNLDLHNNIYKYIHRIKSGSSFLGLTGITRITYEMEFILDILKNEKVNASTELIDSLLLCIDFLNEYAKRLYGELKERNLSNKNDGIYFEFTNIFKEDQILERLKLEHEKYERDSREGYLKQETSLETDNGIEMSPLDGFQSGFAEDVKEQFLIENSEHLEKIENDLLIHLDSNKNDRESIDEIFRVVHSIKGGAGIYLATISPESPIYDGLKLFLDTVHTFESLLSIIRDKEINFEKIHMELSLIVVDNLKSFINNIDSGKTRIQLDNSIIDKINQEIMNIQELPINPVQNVSTTVVKGDGKAENTKSKGSVAQSIRVNQDKIDKMMNVISELIIAKNSFAHITEKLNNEYNLPEISKEVKQVGAYVNRISDELQNSIMAIRMVEVVTVFQKMPRVIRDIAQSTGKKMELIMEGESTEIDKSIIEKISDPLVHLIRNSADHAIESLQERNEKGKPETGRIVLRAYNKNKYVFIEIEDDGKGINPQSIKEKALEKGIISEIEAEKMNESQLINLIFLPGFSMAKQITAVSGRGVGMDIVKSNIEKINGNIAIESEVDKGTKIIIRLPLSLAVSRGLIVEVSNETYIIPLENIVETVKINRNNIHKFNGKYFTYLRETVIGMEWLSKIFMLVEMDMQKEELNAVIISNGIENYAIVVDKLKNEQEFVMKTLDGILSTIPGISGSTLLGNGQVVLIVNPIDVIKLAEA